MKKLSLILFSLSILITLQTASISNDKTILGKAKVIDGDTIKIDKKKIRLFGIDAPEKEQICKKVYLSFFIFSFRKDYKCGEKSTLALKKKLKDKKVKCILEKNKDKYKRNIGTCFVKNQDINKWLVRNGYALAYKRYSKKYVLEEQYAKENKLGIWKGTFIEPEKWRRNMN
tara:strand:+ start:712 stop:1227 length:516 start_codon:yes stop_codon:yes gene_type:complete